MIKLPSFNSYKGGYLKGTYDIYIKLDGVGVYIDQENKTALSKHGKPLYNFEDIFGYPSNELTIFNYSNTEIRTLEIESEPWFVAKDVAGILGYRDSNHMTRRLDKDEKDTRSVGTPGGTQRMSVVSEPGLYRAIMGSKSPEATPFKRFVCHEVLPSIRKTGAYSVAEQMAPPVDTNIVALQQSMQVMADTMSSLNCMNIALSIGLYHCDDGYHYMAKELRDE